MGGHRTPNEMSLNVYPDTEVLARAYAELLVDYTWKSYTIIYEDDDGLMRLKDVLQIHDPESSPITVRYGGAFTSALVTRDTNKSDTSESLSMNSSLHLLLTR